jgi:hydroxypyruvate reductase
MRGRALLQFVDAHDDVLFLISGGGSACVEVPLAGHGEEELIERNAQLVASGMPIEQINAERKKLSAIKGGRLGERVRGNAVTLIYSDVGTGRLEDVASGPSNRNLKLIADNTTLTRTAASSWASSHGPNRLNATSPRQHIFSPAEACASPAGEPTVAVKGGGRGGRCTELAVRFAMESTREALFASSDGVDGNSGIAGIYLPGNRATGRPGDWQSAPRCVRLVTNCGASR